MKNYLSICALAVLAAFTSCQPKTEKVVLPEKPNIIFLFADDQCHNTINALGNKEVITPNLDKMVAEGVTFTNAYNMGSWSGAVCLASRTMMNSGKSVWQAKNYFSKKSAPAKTWGQRMQEQGYETYMTGKWHVHTPSKQSFNHVVHERPGMPSDFWDHATMVQNFKDLKAGKYKSYLEFMPQGYNRPLSVDDHSWSPTDSTMGGFWKGGQHWSEVLRDDAIQFIDAASKKDNPFFMYLAFNAPHDPRQAPQEYQDMYNVDDISVPASFQALYPDCEKIGNGPALRDAMLAPFPRTELAAKVHTKEYYASITHLDAQIGKIMEALKKSGKADNTYIIYSADHGLAVGNHGLFGKQNMYDHSMRMPFIVLGPKLPKNTKVNADIYLQDAMATALDLAGFKNDGSVFFNSVVPLLTGETKESVYPAIYGCYLDLQRMIRKDGYKLIVYPEANTIKLFDLNSDPLEINNIADAKPEMVKTMFAELVELQKEYHDHLDLTQVFQF
ncbi:sulfatase-like hydrolase/transferase [Saccharicrinis aurantiacus]|uniref:sulfatase-like hydrolase/transferase n=1 Tax=Saccharicrinis aurantiacus TaxID=1849719 RepID=UPI00095026A4|nr:sulfatase-like hydrolase/transferase [Saccharicrinis aurantiacus]